MLQVIALSTISIHHIQMLDVNSSTRRTLFVLKDDRDNEW